MTRNRLALLSLFLLTAMVASAIVAGMHLPTSMRLPIHWNFSGQPDNFAGKWPALLMPAVMVAVISLAAWFLPAVEPRAHNLGRSQGLYVWGWAGMLLFGAAIHIVVLSAAFGWNVPADRLISVVCGLLLVMIGNQFGKSRSTYLMGLRTPWTLANEDVWVRTHRLAGKLMVVVGLAVILSIFLPLPAGPVSAALLGLLLAAAIIPIVYSYLLWRRQPRATGDDAGGQSSE